MRVIAVLFLTSLVASLAPVAALGAGQGRVALVIGNYKYEAELDEMKDVKNDTQDVADELRRDGFEVVHKTNLKSDAMRQAFADFYDKIQPGDVALFFFDGFGIQVLSERHSYLLGTDATIWDEKEIPHIGIDLEKIIQAINNKKAEVKIGIIDASRSNQFERVVHHYSAGLAPVNSQPINTLLIFSAATGTVISNARTDHGLFVRELLREIRVPGTSAETAFQNTMKGVSQVTNAEQRPAVSTSMTVDFAFVGGLGPTPTPTPTSPICIPAAAPVPPSAVELANDPQIAAYSRRIQQDPGDRIAYYKRGQLYAIKGAYAPAVTDFDQAIRLNVRDAEAYNNRCWARAATGDLLDALRDCDQALQIKPELYDALDSRGLANLKLGRYPQAINDYNASLDKNPQSSSSMFGRGLASKFSGGDGTADIGQAKSMDHNIASEFMGYGVNECHP